MVVVIKTSWKQKVAKQPRQSLQLPLNKSTNQYVPFLEIPPENQESFRTDLQLFQQLLQLTATYGRLAAMNSCVVETARSCTDVVYMSMCCIYV